MEGKTKNFKRTLQEGDVKVSGAIEGLPEEDECEPFIVRCHRCKKELLRATNLRVQHRDLWHDTEDGEVHTEISWWEYRNSEEGYQFAQFLFEYPCASMFVTLCAECNSEFEDSENDLRLMKKLVDMSH